MSTDTLALRSILGFHFPVNKQALIEKIIAHLANELEVYARAARAAHAEATHEQSKAENKYDTRGLEASYLARGQSKQVAETQLAIKDFQSLAVRSFGPQDPIDLGAVVELENGGEQTLYFVGPRAGGTEVVHEKSEVLVITPESPLGRQIMDKKQGDRLQIEIGGTRHEYKVVLVW